MLHASSPPPTGECSATGCSGDRSSASRVGALRQLPLWPVTIGIVVGWGLALVPFGFDVPTTVTLACFTRSAARSTDRSWRSR